MGAWAAADLWPDVAPALRTLHAAGFQLAVLTNGSGGWVGGWARECCASCSRPGTPTQPPHKHTHAARPLPAWPGLAPAADGIARSVLQKAGLDGCFSHLTDIGMAAAWKPAPASYEFAVRQLGLRPDQVGCESVGGWWSGIGVVPVQWNRQGKQVRGSGPAQVGAPSPPGRTPLVAQRPPQCLIYHHRECTTAM